MAGNFKRGLRLEMLLLPVAFALAVLLFKVASSWGDVSGDGKHETQTADRRALQSPEGLFPEPGPGANPGEPDSGGLEETAGQAPSADNRRLNIIVRTRAPQADGILGYLRVGWSEGKQIGEGDAAPAEGFVSVFGGDRQQELALWLPALPNQLEWQFSDRKEPRFGGGPREGHQGSSEEAAGEAAARVAIPWRDRLAGVPSAGNGVWSFDPENFTGSSHVSHNVDVTLRRAYVPVRLPPSLGMPTQVFVYRQYGAHGIAFPRLELRYGDDDAYLGAVQLRARDEEELDEFGEIKRDDGSAHVRAELIRPKRPATRAEVYDVPTGGNTGLDFGRPLVWCEDGTLWSFHAPLASRFCPSLVVTDRGCSFFVHGHDSPDHAEELGAEALIGLSTHPLQFLVELQDLPGDMSVTDLELRANCEAEVLAESVVRHADGSPLKTPPPEVMEWYRFHESVWPPSVRVEWTQKLDWTQKGTLALAVPLGTEISNPMLLVSTAGDQEKERDSLRGIRAEVVEPAGHDGKYGRIKIWKAY